MTLERRFHATPLYPGSLFPEPGAAVRIDNPGTAVAVAPFTDNDHWFAVEVTDGWWKRWSSGEGDEKWERHVDDFNPTRKHRIYVGDVFTADQVEALGSDYRTLLQNMRGNRWERVVRTRIGNWQPIEGNDVVLAPNAPELRSPAVAR